MSENTDNNKQDLAESENKESDENEVDDLDQVLKSSLPIPSVPKAKEGSVLPSTEEITAYRNELYNYYIQYYARYYISELRKVFRQYNTEGEYPDALSKLPGKSDPTDPINLTNIETQEQLKAFYNQLHFAYNFQSSQVYQQWFTEQQKWIIYSASNPNPVITTTTPNTNTTTTNPTSAYASSAFFNTRTNRFQAQTSEEHWASQGLPLDREGRQMAAFFDVEAYQESQRAISKNKKKPPKQSAKYWRKVKEEKKRRKLMEFLKDDD